jgi:hypothetical protein
MCWRAAAAESMRVEQLDFVQWRWPDAEGPDEKVSRHIGCPATPGGTSVTLWGTLSTYSLDHLICLVQLGRERMLRPTHRFIIVIMLEMQGPGVW